MEFQACGNRHSLEEPRACHVLHAPLLEVLIVTIICNAVASESRDTRMSVKVRVVLFQKAFGSALSSVTYAANGTPYDIIALSHRIAISSVYVCVWQAVDAIHDCNTIHDRKKHGFFQNRAVIMFLDLCPIVS